MAATFPKSGPQGIAGAAGIAPFIYDVTVPSSTITVPHGLHRSPVSVDAFDASGFLVQVGVRVLDDDSIEITTVSGLPFTGKVLVI